jgi:hypothetical protein
LACSLAKACIYFITIIIYYIELRHANLKYCRKGKERVLYLHNITGAILHACALISSTDALNSW